MAREPSMSRRKPRGVTAARNAQVAPLSEREAAAAAATALMADENQGKQPTVAEYRMVAPV
jgi:hypothetical protein